MSDNDNRSLAPIYIPTDPPSSTTMAGYTVTGAVSTASLQVIPTASGFGVPGMGQGYWDFYATDFPVFLVFGPDAAGTPAATALCAFIPAGTYRRWWINGSRSFVRAISPGGAGTLRWVPSDR